MSDRDQKLVKQLNSTDEVLISNALVKIKKEYVKHHTKMQALSKYSVIKTIISFLDHHRFNNIASSILADVCMDPILTLEVIQNNGILLLAKIMIKSTSNDSQSRACRALGNIARSQKGCQCIDQMNIVSSFIKILKDTKDIYSQKMAVRTLCLLSKYSKSKHTIIREKGILCIARLLNSECKEIIIYSIRALADLTIKCNDSCASQLIEANALKLLVELYNNFEENIQELVLTSLKNLVALEIMRTDIIKCGALKLFTEASLNNESTKLTQIATLALCICTDRLHMWENYGVKKSVGLKAIVEKLQYNVFQNIHCQIFKALYPLCYEKYVPSVLIKLNIIKILIQILKQSVWQNKNEHFSSAFVLHILNIKENKVKIATQNFSSKSTESLNCSEDMPLKVCESSCIASSSTQKYMYYINSKSSLTSRKKNLFSDSNYFCSPFESSSKDSPINIDTKNHHGHLIKTSVFQEPMNFPISLTASNALNSWKIPNLNLVHNSCVSSIETSNSQIELCEKLKADYALQESNKPEKKKIKYTNSKSSLHCRQNCVQDQFSNSTDHYVLKLLTQLTFTLKNLYMEIADKNCFSVILACIAFITNPPCEAEKLLSFTVQDILSFEKLVKEGFITEVDTILNALHISTICVQCSMIKNTFKKHLHFLTVIAESEYGFGTLASYLRSPEKTVKLNGIVAISYLINKTSLIKKLIFQHNVLLCLFEILSGRCNAAKTTAFFSLCRIYQKVSSLSIFKNKCIPMLMCQHSYITTKCMYSLSSNHDVIFVIGDKKVGASREVLKNKSTYFNSLLGGPFSEKDNDIIVMNNISSKSLIAILHFLYCCQGENFCKLFKEMTFEELTDLLWESEMFLLLDLKSFLIYHLYQKINSKRASDVYSLAKNLNVTCLYQSALHCLLSTDILHKDIVIKSFEKMINFNKNIVFEDITSLIQIICT